VEDNTKTQNQAIVIIGLLALVVALFLGVKLVFAGLDMAIDSEDTMLSSSSTQVDDTQSGEAPAPVEGEDEEGPAFCTHCGKEMRDGFQWGQFCPYCGKQVE